MIHYIDDLKAANQPCAHTETVTPLPPSDEGVIALFRKVELGKGN